MAQSFFTYMLRCADGSYYIGHTDDIEKRVREHQEGASLYTADRRPVRLVWMEEFQTRPEAKEIESRIKQWSRTKKEALIRGDYGALRAAARKQNWERHRRARAKD